MVINAINLTNVKVFGEMEFWFAIIKVIAVVAMIIFGGWLLFSGNGGPQATVSNLWDQGGFLPHGFKMCIRDRYRQSHHRSHGEILCRKSAWSYRLRSRKR